ncbi:GNAT family N-acetyltransferase, partial [Natronospora cellulosivora (SeqCode)]
MVATAFLWHGNHFGKEFQRVHWVAVHPDHQGKNIGKALITKVLEIYLRQPRKLHTSYCIGWR